MKKTPVLLLIITFAVFAAAVGGVTHWLRGKLRDRFVQQHAAVIQPLAQMQTAEATDALARDGGDPYLAAEMLRLSLQDMETKELILDVQLFDALGFFIAEDPSEQLAAALPPSDLNRALAGFASAHFHANPTWSELFPGDETKTNLGVPVVEVISPLRKAGSPKVLAIARYLLNGEATKNDLAGIDRQIWTTTAGLLLAGLAILATIFFAAFHRLHRSQRLLQASQKQLIAANHELAFAAKSSAIGSISGHLIHGLKNPLASLQSVFTGGGSDRSLTREEVAQCRERIGTMQTMIGDLMGILKDEERHLVYEYTLEDLREMLLHKATPQAQRRGVTLEIGAAPELKLPGRTGNLLLLMLTNLVDNAIDASRAGDPVQVRFGQDEAPLVIDVRDRGPGLPPAVRERLFSPMRSAKEQGGGIGLALAHQMARNIGADIHLRDSDASGTCFRVTLPAIAP